VASYVDNLEGHGWKFRGTLIKSCHLIADEEEELYGFAESIGLKREWVQGTEKGRILHYDLTEGKRKQALANGAVELDKKAFVRKMWELRGKEQGHGQDG